MVPRRWLLINVKITIAVPLKCNLFAQLAHFMATHAPCTLVLALAQLSSELETPMAHIS